MTIKNAVLNSWMDKVKSLNKYDEARLAEIRYGLEAFYLNVPKMIIILIISLILGIAKYTLLLLLFNFPIRSVSFGFHANTSLQCLILSILAFIMLPLLANYFTLNLISKCIIYSCLLIGFWIMAPKDTEKKPLRNNKKRLHLKISSIIVISVYFILSLTLKNNLIINLLTLGACLQLLMISPIPFLIFKQKYNFKWFK